MVISLYAHGMTVRDIVHHLRQVYGTELSAETVSRIAEQVMEEVKTWQSRPLDPVYAVVFPDAIVVKVRDNHVVANKPAYLAVGIDTDGDKHVLGIWPSKTAAGTEQGRRHPQAVKVWEDAWEQVIPFLAFTPPGGAKRSTNSPSPIQGESGKKRSQQHKIIFTHLRLQALRRRLRTMKSRVDCLLFLHRLSSINDE